MKTKFSNKHLRQAFKSLDLAANDLLAWDASLNGLDLLNIRDHEISALALKVANIERALNAVLGKKIKEFR